MKRFGIAALGVGVVFTVGFSLRLLPSEAQAQASTMEQAWELNVLSYSSGDKPRLAVVRHNTMTGQTLILTCDNRCDADEVWRDFDVASAQ